MKIAIDASRAFLKNSTGIEEYSYQVIRHLRKYLKEEEVILFTHPLSQEIDFELPNKWRVKKIRLPRFWTQLGLSFELLIHPVDALFVPAHTVPIIHPKKTVVTVHGLEYEHNRDSYSVYAYYFHRFFIKRSCRWAEKIIAVSKSTQRELVKLYRVPKEKITVVYNGYKEKEKIKEEQNKEKDNFLLFIGRLEERKNIKGIIEAFNILQKRYGYSGNLILAGKPGYGYKQIKEQLAQCDCGHQVKQLGYITEEKKWELIKQADVFMFPSFSEGFGIPILEAQSMGTPVITSNFGPMDEVAGEKDILVNPEDCKAMAKLTDRIIKDNNFREKIIKRGRENVKRFSWDKCAKETAEVLL